MRPLSMCIEKYIWSSHEGTQPLIFAKLCVILFSHFVSLAPTTNPASPSSSESSQTLPTSPSNPSGIVLCCFLSFFFFFPLSWRLNSFQSLCLFKLAWKMFLAVVIADYHCAVVVVSVHSSPCWLSLFDAFIKWNLKIIYNMNKINQDGSFLGGPRSQTELNQKDLRGLRTINCKKSRKSSKSRLTFELTSLSMVSMHVFLDVISCNRYLTFVICL